MGCLTVIDRKLWENSLKLEEDLVEVHGDTDLILVEGTKTIVANYLIQHEDDLVEGMSLKDLILANYPDAT